MTLPGEFVSVDEADRGLYEIRAVSADGVVLALRRQDNRAGGTLAFWTRAVTDEMVAGRGYALSADDAVTAADGRNGRTLTFTTKRRGVDYTYLLTLFAGRRTILITEAGGKADAVKAHLDEIKKAMLTAK